MALTALNKAPVSHTHKVDCWGVGILLCEVLIGRSPFTSSSASDIVKNIMKAEISEEYRQKLGGAYEAVTSLVKVNPDDRMELSEWREIPWIVQQVKIYVDKRLTK